LKSLSCQKSLEFTNNFPSITYLENEIIKIFDGNKMLKKFTEISLQDTKKFLENYSTEKLQKLKERLDILYYSGEGESPVEDAKYDVLVKILKNKIPKTVGAVLRTGENRVEIPFWLGSLDKITPEENVELLRWVKKNHAKKYTITEKLDGVSCLYMYTPEKGIKLYTRGDGIVGADISYLVPYFTLPKIRKSLAIRGELIMKKKIFDNKYKGKFKNPRNMIAGLVGAKTSREGLKDIDFVVYEILGDETMPSPSEQLTELISLGFQTVLYENIPFSALSIDTLSEMFLRFRNKSEYELDGIVVQSDVPYDRNTSGNPEYSFAFKMLLGDAIKETVVKYVEWNISKWGQYKPVAVVEPVELSGVTINRATVHNAKYVSEEGIGKGAIVKITRSKEVIPYIVEVVKKATAEMPDSQKYVWDKTHTNILVSSGKNSERDQEMCVKLIASFFSQIGIKFVSEATVEKLYENGLNNLLKILEADKDRLMQVPGIHEKSAERIYTNIHTGLKNIKLSLFLGASGIFGFGIGKKRVESLLLAKPDILKISDQNTLVKEIMSVDGFSDITAIQVAKNMKYATLLIKKMKKYTTFKTETRISDDMVNHKYVMTGFRDKKLEEIITQRGGKMVSSISKNTTALIISVNPTGKPTGKFLKAQELGIPVYTKEDFVKKFINK